MLADPFGDDRGCKTAGIQTIFDAVELRISTLKECTIFVHNS